MPAYSDDPWVADTDQLPIDSPYYADFNGLEPGAAAELGDPPMVSFGQQNEVSAGIQLIGFINPTAGVIAEVLALLEDLIRALIDLFSGRPRDEATRQIIAQFLKSPNMIGATTGILLNRLYEDFDIVVSSSGENARQLLGQVASYYYKGMMAQGYTRAQCKEAYDYMFSRASQDGGPLPAMLKKPVPDGYYYNADQETATILCAIWQWWIAQGKSPGDAANRALSQVIRRRPLRWVFKITVSTVQALAHNCPSAPTTTQRPWDHQCTPGYKYDAAQKLCVIDPSKWPTQGSTTDGGNPDPVTCTQLGQYVQSISEVLQNLNPDPVTCAQLNDAVQAFATSVSSAIAATATADSHPIDLEAVIRALDQIAQSISSRPRTDLSGVTKELEDLRVALGKPLEGIAHDMATQTSYGDVPVEIIRQLITDGLIDEQYSGLLQGSPWSHVLSVVHGLANSNTFQKIAQSLKKAVGYDPSLLGIINHWVAGTVGDKNGPTVSDFAEGTGKIAAALFSIGSDISAEVWGPTIDKLLNVHADTIASLHHVRPGEEASAAAKLLTEAISAGTAAHFGSVAAETVYPTKNLGFSQLAGVMAELAGFKEIMEGIIRPEVRQAVTIPHTYKINAQARGIQPNLAQADNWYARGLIDEARWTQLVAWNGLHPDNDQAAIAAAHRPAQAFAMLRGIGVVNIDRSRAHAALTFAGYRDSDIEDLIDAAERQGLQSLRNGVISELLNTAAEGMWDEATFTSELTALDLTPQAQNLLLQHVRIKRLGKLTRDYKNELDESFRGGVIEEPDYRTAMAAVGYQATEIDIFTGQINARREARTLADHARETARIDAANLELRTRAALEEYRRGNITEPALLGALIAVGLTPTQAAAHTALATAQAQPTLRQGVKLTKFAQRQADEALQAKAILERYGRGQITTALARQELTQVGWHSAQITAALRYEYAKSRKKAPVDSP